jgi:hypothetical protein
MGMTISDAHGHPRYRISVVDDPERKTIVTYSVFIVPIGR